MKIRVNEQKIENIETVLNVAIKQGELKTIEYKTSRENGGGLTFAHELNAKLWLFGHNKRPRCLDNKK